MSWRTAELVGAVAGGRKPLPRTMIVAAHPDDESASAGSRLPHFEQLLIVTVTDGAPLSMYDAIANGFVKRHEYVAARRREMAAALECQGLNASCVHHLGCADQQAPRRLVDLTRQLTEMITDFGPELILTHPYEGGHPDHDSSALAVHAAVKLAGDHTSRVGEFTSYHAGAAGIRTGEFLPSDQPVFTAVLSPAERDRKQRMLECFRTQQNTLQYFAHSHERYRPAPVYDFTSPPHPGLLFYERYNWGTTGAEFRSLAQEALNALGLESPL